MKKKKFNRPQLTLHSVAAKNLPFSSTLLQKTHTLHTTTTSSTACNPSHSSSCSCSCYFSHTQCQGRWKGTTRPSQISYWWLWSDTSSLVQKQKKSIYTERKLIESVNHVVVRESESTLRPMISVFGLRIDKMNSTLIYRRGLELIEECVMHIHDTRGERGRMNSIKPSLSDFFSYRAEDTKIKRERESWMDYWDGKSKEYFYFALSASARSLRQLLISKESSRQMILLIINASKSSMLAVCKFQW